MASSGVLSGSLNQLRLQRGTVRIPIAAGTFLTNISIVGDTFQIATLGEFILDTILKPSAASTDINYTVELFNETTQTILQSFDCKVAPVSAPDDQSWLFTIDVVDVTHFYSLRITTTQGNPSFAMSLSGPTFTMVISSLTGSGGGGSVTATPPIFVDMAGNITLGASPTNAVAPTTADAASSVTWSPIDAAHKALVLQGQAAQSVAVMEVQTSLGVPYFAIPNSPGTTGVENLFIGDQAGTANVAGTRNVFVGFQAGVVAAGAGDGDSVLVGWKAGNNMNGTAFGHNTCVGTLAGEGITTGFGNTYLGYGSGGLIAGVNNNIGIGDNCVVLGGASGSVVIGQAAVVGSSQISIGQNVGFDDPSNTGTGNILIGSGIGSGVLTTASSNVIIGNLSYPALNTASANVVIGYQALNAATVDDQVVMIGYQAGLVQTAGAISTNVFIGYQAGVSNTIGTANTFLGYLAGGTNIIGNNNTYLGVTTGLNSVGDRNTAVGVSAGGGGDDNVAIGFVAGQALTVGSAQNTLIGTNSGQGLLTGINNTYVGFQSGANSSTDSDNTFVGWRAGSSAFGGSGSNSALGSFAAGALQTGALNTFLGYSAGESLTVNNRCTFVGAVAGPSVDGNDNIAIGYQSASALLTGTFNIHVGNNSRTADPATIRTVVVGHQSVGSDDSVVIGYNTGINQTASTENVLIGTQTGNSLTSGGSNTFVGRQTGTVFDTGAHNIAIGEQIAGGAGFSFCTLLGAQLTATATNDLQLVSGDCGLQRADPAVIAFTGGQQVGVTPGGAFQLTGIPTVSAPPLSPVNTCRFYYDSTLQQVMISKNGGAYAALTIP